MATLVLAAAGSAAGSAVGGAFLGVSAAAIGQAAGAVAGGLIDQRMLGGGARVVETGRARSLRLQGATEGTPLARVYGRMRIAGTLIWSTRFLESVRRSNQGAKGGGGAQTREFSYSISFAVALCEGRIDRIGRIWADGALLDRTGVTLRVHTGGTDQMPDPKLEAVEGAGMVPAFRGTAYVVFDDLPLAPFGNRIPQLSFEVFRSVEDRAVGPEAAPETRALVRAVALSPGTGEFALETEPTLYTYGQGDSQSANIHNSEGRPDLLAGLDQLEAELPGCGATSLIVSWFGDDLRAGRCLVQPRAEATGRSAKPEAWSVAGLTPETARLVSTDAQGRPNFGGTPSDGSVIRAIQEIAGRGLTVMLYPFLLMDIPAGNALADPHGTGAEQPAFPWRGRITLDAAPGQPGSADRTAAAEAEVAAFFGTVKASDFAVSDGMVTYSGPDEWSWSRFALHLAALGAAAGGVDAICIASEMRGLTTIRSDRTTYPAVAHLRALAAEVRTLLPGAKIGYAADWSEYFGHQPADGSGDRLFHLDPLWADAQIDFVGIDDYLPLSDWRHTAGHLDGATAPAVHSLPYLRAGMEGGEHYDWYYASEADRDAQLRSPIVDTAHGEDWVFRPKDLRNWWANPHHDRIGGVRQTAPTAWVPQSKPLWLTETGCPAVDLGANRPNLFLDPKSSESALPTGSTGARDDEMQRRFLQAKLGYWQEAANNPVSPVYGGLMIPDGRVYVWTWDTRPFPDYPMRESVWSDGPAHAVGHWITGRIGAGSLGDVVHEILHRSGVAEIDVSQLYGTVHGLVLERVGTAREALQPLMLAHGFDVVESGGRLVCTMRGLARALPLDRAWLVEGEDALGPVVRVRAAASETAEAVRLGYVEAEGDYRVGSVEARAVDSGWGPVSETSLPLALPGSTAQVTADRWLAEGARARDRVSLTLPPSMASVEAGDVVSLAGPGGAETYRVERLTAGLARAVEAVRIEAAAYRPAAVAERRVETVLPTVPGALEAVFLDLPLADGTAGDHQPRLAVAARPWPGPVTVWWSGSDAGYQPLATVEKSALIGALAEALPPGRAQLWQRVDVTVSLPTGALSVAERLAVLNGANVLAVEAQPGVWEIVQARDAVLIGPGLYRLGRLLRGRRGTEALAQAEIAAGSRVVVLDDAVVTLPVPLETRGLPRHLRVGRSDRGWSDAGALHSVETFGGIGLRPFSPARLRGVRTAEGALEIGWTRRTRIGGDSWEGVEVPLGEAVEGWRVRVLRDGAVRRVVETAGPAWTYASAAQAEDAGAGALEIRVSQRSDAYGYGPEQGIMIHD